MLIQHLDPAATARVALERNPEPLAEPEFVAEAPLESFGAFWADTRVFGWVRLTAARLTDLLNAHAELALVNASIERLDDGRTELVEEIRVRCDQLVAVQASGRRGDPALRRRTRQHPVAAQSGAWLLAGFLHVPPGHDPLADIATRPALVPLTDAWLEYWTGGRAHRQWVGTMIFNRHLATSIQLLAERDGELDRPVWRPPPG